MKKAVLPQPKRRIHLAGFPTLPDPRSAPGQLVEIVKGELAGARGIVIMATKTGRWLIRLEGTPQGITLSIPPDGLRLVTAKRR